MAIIERETFSREAEAVKNTTGAAVGIVALAADRLLRQDMKEYLKQYARDALRKGKEKILYRRRMR